MRSLLLYERLGSARSARHVLLPRRGQIFILHCCLFAAARGAVALILSLLCCDHGLLAFWIRGLRSPALDHVGPDQKAIAGFDGVSTAI